MVKETHFLILVKESKKGSSQVHGRFKLLLSVEVTLQHLWEPKKKTFKTLLTLPNSYLHLFVLFFYILTELILHFTDSVSHYINTARF